MTVDQLKQGRGCFFSLWRLVRPSQDATSHRATQTRQHQCALLMMASSIFGAEQRIGEPLSALAVLTGRHREKNTRDPVLVNTKRNQRNQRVNDIGNMVYYCNQQGVQAGSVSHRGTACSSPQGRTHRVGYTTQKTKARVEEKARERRTSRAGDGSRP